MSGYAREHPDDPFGNQPYFQRIENEALAPLEASEPCDECGFWVCRCRERLEDEL